MPYHIVEDGGRFCVQKKDGSKRFGCHDTRLEAEAQMRAIYANEGKSGETLIHQGGAIKALGDGKIGGYLILFGGQDLVGDYFAATTDYGPHKSTVVFYHHGLDAILKRRVLDDDAALKIDDVGVWVDAQLALRDQYERAIYGMVEGGKLGWSSGTAAHLVQREEDGKASRITSWPLGLDASLTPTPAEPRTKAVPLKSIISELQTSCVLAALDYDDNADAVLTAAKAFTDRARTLIERRVRDGRQISEERREDMKQLRDLFTELYTLSMPRCSNGEARGLQLDAMKLELELAPLLAAGA